MNFDRCLREHGFRVNRKRQPPSNCSGVPVGRYFRFLRRTLIRIVTAIATPPHSVILRVTIACPRCDNDRRSVFRPERLLSSTILDGASAVFLISVAVLTTQRDPQLAGFPAWQQRECLLDRVLGRHPALAAGRHGQEAITPQTPSRPRTSSEPAPAQRSFYPVARAGLQGKRRSGQV